METLHRLIYTSRRAPGCDAAQVRDILRQARPKNGRLDVTGVLMVSTDGFCQVLEGPKASVETLYDRIARDDRHVAPEVVDNGPADTRAFAEWEMLEVAVSDEELPRAAGARDPFARELLALAQRKIVALR